jgi:tetratricopeptide (TPR) repeat protein
MGKQLVKKLLQTLKQMEWPDSGAPSGRGRHTYEVGLEKISSCKNDPAVLLSALDIFQTGDSKPYAFAGIAHTLVAASRENNGSYTRKGLNAAMSWLEKAQAIEPDIVEINMIEAFIYSYAGRFNDARIVLDYLQRRDPANYYVHLAEATFWNCRQSSERMIYWLEQAVDTATTIPQRLRLLIQLGDYYAQSDKTEEAMERYREVLEYDKANARVWHKMSVIYWHQEDYDEAERCNRVALSLEELSAARKMHEALRKKRAGSGMRLRLFGR